MKMISRHHALTAMIITAALTGCAPPPPPASPLPESQIDANIATAAQRITFRDPILKTDEVGYEATEWLRSNKNELALASNHFGPTEKAGRFVRELYRWGAAGVYVVYVMDEPDRIEGEGGPYADTLFCFLPDDPSFRRKLESIGGPGTRVPPRFPHPVFDREYLVFWWD